MKRANLFINRINLSQTVLHTHDSWSWKAFWAFDKACDFISAASESVQEKFQAKCKSKSNIMYMFVCTTFCSESELYLTICISILHVNQHSTLDCFHILLGRGFFQFFQNLLCAFIRLWTWKSIWKNWLQSNSLISKILQLPGGLITQWEEKDSIRYFPRYLAEYQSIVNFRTHIFCTFISSNLQVEIIQVLQLVLWFA